MIYSRIVLMALAFNQLKAMQECASTKDLTDISTHSNREIGSLDKIGVGRADAIQTIIAHVKYVYLKPIESVSGPVIGKIALHEAQFTQLADPQIFRLYHAAKTKAGSFQWLTVVEHIKEYPEVIQPFIQQKARAHKSLKRSADW